MPMPVYIIKKQRLSRMQFVAWARGPLRFVFSGPKNIADPPLRVFIYLWKQSDYRLINSEKQ